MKFTKIIATAAVLSQTRALEIQSSDSSAFDKYMEVRDRMPDFIDNDGNSYSRSFIGICFTGMVYNQFIGEDLSRACTEFLINF